jgi:CBS domain-containing protein
MYVSQVMTSPVISVHVDTTVEELARVLTTYRLRSVPVVDEANRVIGLVRESDLFVHMQGVPFSRERLPALFGEWVDLARLDEAYAMARRRTAGQVMRSEGACVHVCDTLEEVVRVMLEQEVESLPVVSNGALVGVISRSDLLRLWAMAG